MGNTKQSETITAKISATPNPISFGEQCAVISWETDDSGGGEIRVVTSAHEEKLVTRGGRSRRVAIDWIMDSTEYEFRLYPLSQPEAPIDSVGVRCDGDSASVVLGKARLCAAVSRPRPAISSWYKTPISNIIPTIIRRFWSCLCQAEQTPFWFPIYGQPATSCPFFWHMMGNKFLTLLSNMFTNLNLTDVETGDKAFKASLIKSIPIEEDGFAVEPELVGKLARTGCRIYEVGISYSGRKPIRKARR